MDALHRVQGAVVVISRWRSPLHRSASYRYCTPDQPGPTTDPRSPTPDLRPRYYTQAPPAWPLFTILPSHDNPVLNNNSRANPRPIRYCFIEIYSIIFIRQTFRRIGNNFYNSIGGFPYRVVCKQSVCGRLALFYLDNRNAYWLYLSYRYVIFAYVDILIHRWYYLCTN